LKALALFRDDYSKSIHVREIARQVGVDPSTILSQLQKLVSLNVLTYSLVPRGRNKEYRLNLENLSTKYCMVEAEANLTLNFLQGNYLIKKILSELDRDLDGIVILFGSYARGAATAKSDVDILVITSTKINERLIEEEERIVGKDISVQRASRSRFLDGLRGNEPLMKEVVGNHILLKGIDDFCDVLWHYHGGH